MTSTTSVRQQVTSAAGAAEDFSLIVQEDEGRPMYDREPRSVATSAIDPSPQPWHARVEASAEDISALAKSMRTDGGADHAISVRPATNPSFTWEVIAGRLRLLGAIELGLPMVEVVVRDVADAEARIISLRENEGRRGLPYLEIGWAAVDALRNSALGQRELAEQVGISESKMSEVCGYAGAIPRVVAEEMTFAAGKPLSAISTLPRHRLRILKNCDPDTRRLRLADILTPPHEDASSGSADDVGRSDVEQLAADIRRLALRSKLRLVWLIFTDGISWPWGRAGTRAAGAPG